MILYNVYFKGANLSPTLYGFTNNKSIINSFKKQRKNKLYKIIEKEITKKEYTFIIKHTSELEMKNRKLKTKDNDGDIITVEFVMTGMEEKSVYSCSDKIFIELSKITSKISDSFNDDINEALDILGYYQLFVFRDDYINRNFGIQPYFKFDSEMIEIDEFEIFMRLYSNVLSVK